MLVYYAMILCVRGRAWSAGRRECLRDEQWCAKLAPEAQL